MTVRMNNPSESVSIKDFIPSSEGTDISKHQCIKKIIQDEPDRVSETSLGKRAITQPEKKAVKRTYSESEVSNSDVPSLNNTNIVDPSCSEIKNIMSDSYRSGSETKDIAPEEFLDICSIYEFIKQEGKRKHKGLEKKRRLILKQHYESIKKLLGLEKKSRKIEILKRCNQYVQYIKSMMIFLSDEEMIIGFSSEKIDVKNKSVNSESNNKLINSRGAVKDKKTRDVLYRDENKSEINQLKEALLVGKDEKTEKYVLQYFLNWVERWRILIFDEVHKKARELIEMKSPSDTPSKADQKYKLLVSYSLKPCMKNISNEIVYRIPYGQGQIEAINNCCNVFGGDKFKVICLVFDYLINNRDRYPIVGNECLSNTLGARIDDPKSPEPFAFDIINDLPYTSDFILPLEDERTIDLPLYTPSIKSSHSDSKIRLDDIVSLL